MANKLDILFVHANGAEIIFQALHKDFSAIEPPIWAAMLAQACRTKGHEVAILDCESERITTKQSVEEIIKHNAKIVCFVIYGQNPNASSQNMDGSLATASLLKQYEPDAKVLFVGAHVAALPKETLAEPCVDMVCQNEGVYTILNLLNIDPSDECELKQVKGLGFKSEGHIHLNPPERIVPKDRLEMDLPGMAWDLLPHISKYRTAPWHSWSNDTDSSRFAALYTSLGCSYKCFPTGTKVITSNCPNKPIQKIQVGDKLIGYDVKTGKLAETEVMKTFSREHEGYLLRIKFENGKTIKCTDEHPFYVHGEWIEARDLKIGDEIHSMNFKEKIAFNKHLYNPSFAPEAKERLSVQMKELLASGKVKNNFTDKEWHKKHPPYSARAEGKDNFYQQHSERMKNQNPMFREDVREKVSNTQKEMIKSGELVPFMMTDKYWEQMTVSPNKMEQKFGSLLETNFPEEWKFVGDGSVRFDYYSPDFINVNGKKKIIELHGCYWHKCSACHPEFEGVEYNRDKDRVKTYEKYGFKTLEVWQHELKDEESLLKRIGEFLYNGLKIVEIKKYGLRKPIIVHNFECYPHDNYFVGLSRASADYVLSHNCSFCMINIINRTDQADHITAEHSNVFRWWEPEFIIKQFDQIAEMGVKNVKIADELFVYMPKHFIKVCDLIIERGYDFNIWCYSRVDSCKPEYLDKLAKAGVKWLGIGVENPNQTLRKEVHKGGYKEVKIEDLFKMMRDHGISIGANYIFGLPMDDMDSMKYTADFMMSNLTENMNLYTAMALPGSPLHLEAKQKGIKLPDRYAGYSQHGYYTQNLSNDYLSAEQILRFRDETWMKYFTNPDYLSMMKTKFGDKCVENIQGTTKIKLKRRLFGDKL